MMKTRFTSILTKATMMLLLMMLTATTAWAEEAIDGLTYNSTGGYYEIPNAAALNALATYVNSGHNGSGKTFKLTDDITYTHTTDWDATSTESNFTPIGNYDYPFYGNFDGDDKTIRGLRINSSQWRIGLFGMINGAEVKNVTLADARIAGSKYTGGIVGHSIQSTITNCHVCADVAIMASSNTYGGIVGENYEGTVSSCSSAVKIIVVSGTPSYLGGIAGSNVSSMDSRKATLTDNVVIGAVIPSATRNTYAAIAVDDNSGSGTNDKYHVSYAHNYYYLCTVAGAENATNVGIATYKTSTASVGDLNNNDNPEGAVYSTFYVLTLADGITAEPTPATTVGGTPYYRQGTTITLSGKQSTPELPVGSFYDDSYAVNGNPLNGNSFKMPAEDVTVTSNTIQCHTLTVADGITATATPTITVSGTHYYRPGTTVALSYTGTLPEGSGPVYTMTKDGTSVVVTTPGTFSMPASNVTITVTVTDLWGVSADPAADGSADHPYVITNAAGLDLLAQRVNGGEGYGSTYFKLMNDIAYPYATAWNAADSQENNFTRIGTGAKSFYGTFDGQGHTISGIRIYSSDYCQGLFGNIHGTVRNVILADARITGQHLVGGIAGISEDGTIENCHVTANVLIGSTGDNPSRHGGIAGCNQGTVDGCTSSATLSQAQECGGIVGCNESEQDVVKNCLAMGVTIYGYSDVGAIVGNEVGTLSHNYYSDCTVGGNTSGIGCSDGDVTANDGAVEATILSDAESVPTDLSGKVAFRREFTGGKASTVIFPFDYDRGTEGTYYTFGGVTYDGNKGKWIATMNEYTGTTLSANTPYLFVPAGTEAHKPVLFHGEAAASISAGTTTNGDWQFKGVYAEKTWAAADCGRDYGFAATSGKATDGATDVEAGDFVMLAEGAHIKPLRSYLTYTGTDNPWATTNAPAHRASTGDMPASISVVLVSADGSTTSLENVQCSMFNVQCDNSWFTLSGTRLNGKPSAKGLYIHNGKKVVIK